MNRTALGKNLEKRLAKRGWSKTRLAQEMHVSSVAVCNWVHGKRIPSAYSLYRMAKILGCQMEELVDGMETEETEKDKK